MVSGVGYGSDYSYYLSQLTQSQGTDKAQSSSSNSGKTTIESRADNGTEYDELILSDVDMRQFGATYSVSGGQKPSGPPPGGGPPLKGASGAEESGSTSYAEQLAEKEESFYEELMAKLEEAGVDTEQDIELGYDEHGNIIVTSDMDADNKALIESMLAADTEMTLRFNELSDMKEAAAEMEAMADQRPPQPPEGMPGQGMQGQGVQNWMADGRIASVSNVASMYASQSNMTANSVIAQVAQTAT